MQKATATWRLMSFFTVLVFMATVAFPLSSQSGTVKETEDLRDRIVVESGLQVFKPSLVRGAWELYLLGKQVWWAGKVFGLVSLEPDYTAPIVLALREIPKFTAEDISQAFGNQEVLASDRTVALFNELASIEEPLTANIIAFTRTQQSYKQAVAAGDTEAQEARFAEAQKFGDVIKELSQASLGVMEGIVESHAADKLGNPVMTLEEAEVFIKEVNEAGLPANERRGLLALGLPQQTLEKLETFIAEADPTTAVGISLMDVFQFGLEVNRMMPAEVDIDLEALRAFQPNGDMIPFEYTHNVNINGEIGVAKATGMIDLVRGRLIYEGIIDRYIPGYLRWPVSWLTLIIISGGPIFALEEGGAQNLYTLTKGELGYKVEVQTFDNFAEITTQIAVERRGDTVAVTLDSVGRADYPEVVAMADEPVLLTQTPGDNGSFVEEGTKHLLTADGRTIESNVIARYSGVELPSAQVREVKIQALEESADGLQVTLQVDNTVRPMDRGMIPFEYTHNVNINGEVGVAKATGLIDLARGRLIYEGIIDRYIPGYLRWPVSWLTLIIISGGPIFALEEAGAQNLYTLTKGELGYKVQVSTQDDYADILTDIAVERRGDVVAVTLDSTGRADYPEIVAMAKPMVRLTQTPTSEGFVEEGVKQLVAEDGTVIRSFVKASYSGVTLPAPQLREVTISVLEESQDGLQVQLQVDNVVKPHDRNMLPFEYVHAVNINGQRGVATVTGLIDLLTGRLIYEGFIDRYIEGYRWWPVSWVTLVIISGGPVFALEEGGAQNLYTLTRGQLGHKIAVETRDEFASINTDIGVEYIAGTVVATLESVGEAKYPDVVGMSETPVILTQMPTEGGFVEEGVKELIAADGQIIESSVVATYTGVTLPSAQRREVHLSVLEESEDKQYVRLQVDNVVKPLVDEKLTYSVELWEGINLLAVPLDPSPPEWRLSDLGRHIGEALSFIAWYDHAAKRFISYFPDFPETSPANKPVVGGEGYIVVVQEPVTVTFEGRGWSNTLAAPPMLANAIPVLVVDGLVFDDRTGAHLNGATVIVRNQRTGAVADSVIGASGVSGSFAVTFANLHGKAIAEAGDSLALSIVATNGEPLMPPMAYRLTADALKTYRVTLDDLWAAPIPTEFAVFNNYPNPFNPETWIPYQLPQSAVVSIEIYQASGQLVRALHLGEQPAGTYLSRTKAAYWDGRNTLGERVTSGVYFYVVKAGSFSDMKKMVILK